MTQQTAPAPKFCKDCRHYLPADYEKQPQRAEFSRCAAIPSPESARLHLVDGRPIVGMYCEVARTQGSKCGPDGAVFEPAQATEAA